MRVSKEEFLARPDLKVLLSEDVIIYPTDTVYGIGCDARKERLIARIRRFKGTDAPFSVIAPSKAWIHEHCIVGDHADWLGKLPGPYTLVFPKRDPQFLDAAAPGRLLGVRIPDHWFTRLVQELELPFVTTSVNRSGDPPAADVTTIDTGLVIDEGPIKARASEAILLDGEPQRLR